MLYIEKKFLKIYKYNKWIINDCFKNVNVKFKWNKDDVNFFRCNFIAIYIFIDLSLRCRAIFLFFDLI